MSPIPSTIPALTVDQLQAALPKTPLYGVSGEDSGVGWLLSPTPYPLTAEQVGFLERLGSCLYDFSKGLDALYKASLRETSLEWVKTLFEAGKPPHLISFSQMNRFKQHVPLVIRPDLLVTEDGFTLCEIDAVPGGIGFTGALQQAYQASGFSLVGTAQGVPRAFLQMLLAAGPQGLENPWIAVLVSDEAVDYRPELTWLVDSIRAFYSHIAIVHPRQITLERNQLGFVDDAGTFIPLQILYRFFELFDLPNIPQIELIQYAVKKGLVFCTPPFKPYLEEKLALALIHAPFLQAFWQSQLGDDALHLLQRIVPQSWILDPAPVPPHARITPDLVFAGQAHRDFSTLGTLTQKQRELVIKPSGFSAQAWGSRGVKIGHDLSQDVWQAALNDALSQFNTTPHLLQRFIPAKLAPYTYFDPQTGQVIEAQGRTRLCPYYFVQQGQAELVAVLATTCPKDKKIIHGMRDGVMRPVFAV